MGIMMNRFELLFILVLREDLRNGLNIFVVGLFGSERLLLRLY